MAAAPQPLLFRKLVVRWMLAKGCYACVWQQRRIKMAIAGMPSLVMLRKVPWLRSTSYYRQQLLITQKANGSAVAVSFICGFEDDTNN